MFNYAMSKWHQTLSYEVLTAKEAIKLSNLDTKIERKPTFIINPVDKSTTKLPTLAIVREDGTVLGSAKGSYHLIQNTECFAILDPVIAHLKARYVGANQINNGQTIFVTIDFPLMTINTSKKGDLIKLYTCVFYKHGKEHSIKILCIFYRTLCNTGLLSQNIRAIDIHQKSILATQAIITSHITDCYDAFKISAKQMMSNSFSDADVKQLINKLLPVYRKHSSTRLSNIHSHLFELFHKGIGLASVQNTQWAAYVAVAQYVDHDRTVVSEKGKTIEETKFVSSFLSNGAALKQKAFKLLITKIVT